MSGQTPWGVSRLSFGTAQLHRVFGRAAQRRLLHEVIEMGFTHFDCAPLYGCGYNEDVVGSVLADRKERVTIASKVGLYPHRYCVSQTGLFAAKVWGKVAGASKAVERDFNARRAADSLRASLKRLRRETLDLLLLHEPPDNPAVCEDILEWLSRERDAGSILSWGIAGDFPAMSRWLVLPERFVVQVRNSTLDAAQLRGLSIRAEMVFTFSCLSHRDGPACVEQRFHEALAKNPSGSLVVSSRRAANLRALVKWANTS